MFNLEIVVLSNRWADLQINTDDQSTMFYFEKVPNDALSDILLSAIRALGNGIDSTIIFYNGSQKEIMNIKSIDKESCNIAFEKCSLILTKRLYAKAVIRMFDKYVYAYSQEDYESEWGGFPSQELGQLRGAYHAI